MPLKLVPLREEMAEDWTTIYLDAFANSSANQVMVPVRTADVHAAFSARTRAGASKPGAREFTFVIIDTSLPSTNPSVPEGLIIGCCKWKHELASDQAPHDADLNSIPGANNEARKVFFGLIDGARAEIMAGKDFVHLLFLAVAPKQEGRGAGRVCMDWGVKLADELGLPAYLDATPPGKRLYEKYGYETVRVDEMDLRPYGGKESYWTCAMLRPARTNASATTNGA